MSIVYGWTYVKRRCKEFSDLHTYSANCTNSRISLVVAKFFEKQTELEDNNALAKSPGFDHFRVIVIQDMNPPVDHSKFFREKDSLTVKTGMVRIYEKGFSNYRGNLVLGHAFCDAIRVLARYRGAGPPSPRAPGQHQPEQHDKPQPTPTKDHGGIV